MCGICGALDLTGRTPVAFERVQAMADTMVHRGPDDQGVYVSPDRRLGFGFRRLSIVDLVGGRQPMSNEDGSVWVVYNGEVYNHGELRRELEGRGHRYRTRSDTESILHAYEEWGERCVERLRGMFAFAIYDGRTGAGDLRAAAAVAALGSAPRLFLARDRIGIKPLYYLANAQTFLFASEIKGILAWPGMEREVDEEALHHYLTLSATPAPLTMMRGIRKLPPGHTLTVHGDGRLELQQYWEPLFPDDPPVDAREEPRIIERLRELLRESIRLRMMSDVPFGVFLSGGVDSSLNVALMSELMDRPVDTFSVAIEGDPLSDERSHARAVAAHFGASHHEVLIRRRDFVDFLPKMVRHQDEPLADPVCVPLYFVSRLARECGTIVIQVGEGADELFAGYPGYSILADFHRRLYGPFSQLPPWIKRPIAGLAPYMLPARRAEYVRRAAAGQELFWGGAAVFSDETKRRLLRDGGDGRPDTYRRVVAAIYAHFDAQCPGRPFLDRMIYLELRHRLPELLLMRVDKMSMAASVEARVPYLDHELVRFALSIPSTLKVHRGRTKYILKQAARGILPDEVIDRAKRGFCGGAANMVAGPLLDYAEEAVLGCDWLRSLFNMEAVRPLLAGQRAGGGDGAMAVWNLLNLALWHRRWIEEEPAVA
ncbi:MAG: asparagine synthase (glutamine-hydrolyzing) [Gemmatimonadetes bacterium]|nr:asparagine synthase (glutamine-hydrolyzing) [Gemmatimonadota bacterium]